MILKRVHKRLKILKNTVVRCLDLTELNGSSAPNSSRLLCKACVEQSFNKKNLKSHKWLRNTLQTKGIQFRCIHVHKYFYHLHATLHTLSVKDKIRLFQLLGIWYTEKNHNKSKINFFFLTACIFAV